MHGVLAPLEWFLLIAIILSDPLSWVIIALVLGVFVLALTLRGGG